MGTEILALHVRECAEYGGHTCLSSGWTVYNELSTCHPEELRTLMAPNWPIQVSGKRGRYITAPLFQVQDNKVFVCVDPGRLGPHFRAAAGQVPTLTPLQKKALSTMMEVAGKHKHTLISKPGDLIYINNFAMLHAREQYKDGYESTRHLTRMWLRNSNLGCVIPDNMKVPWEVVFGTRSTTVVPKYPESPESEYKIPRYVAGSAAFVVEDSDSDDEVCVAGSSRT